MDLQDLLFQRNWRQIQMTSVVGQRVFTTWRPFSSHMRWRQATKTCRQSSELARWACATCAPSTSVFVVLPGCLERRFVSSSVQPWVWRGRSRVAPTASANKWPHRITALPSQMSSSKTSHSPPLQGWPLYSKFYLVIFSFELNFSFRLILEGTWADGPLRATFSALWVSVLSIQPRLVAPTREKRYTPWHNLWQACETRPYLLELSPAAAPT